ncbi:MAG: hypothetical protein VXZ40_01200 [Nanoarchaeota archaeon]|nr:hypothetical protein [Nanoarchaeota archaeon]
MKAIQTKDLSLKDFFKYAIRQYLVLLQVIIFIFLALFIINKIMDYTPLSIEEITVTIIILLFCIKSIYSYFSITDIISFEENFLTYWTITPRIFSFGEYRKLLYSDISSVYMNKTNLVIRIKSNESFFIGDKIILPIRHNAQEYVSFLNNKIYN